MEQSDYVTLLGAEQVQNAGHHIWGAAEQIRSASGNIDNSVFQLRQILDEFAGRMEAVAERIEKAMEPTHAK